MSNNPGSLRILPSPRTLPTFSLEKRLWKKGYKLVVGVDEVGRGALAGPVVAGAVVFECPTSPFDFTQGFEGTKLAIKEIANFGIDDSKRLSPKTRLKLAAEIKECCLNYVVASESVGTINRLGIVKATEKAMRKAIKKLQSQKVLKSKSGKTFVIVDGFHVKYIPGVGLKNQKNIFDGDRKCISIAAASILAKVYRDKLMEKLSQNPKYKKYGWQSNKGYGTKRHILAIKRYGLTRLHRKKFVRNI